MYLIGVAKGLYMTSAARRPYHVAPIVAAGPQREWTWGSVDTAQRHTNTAYNGILVRTSTADPAVRPSHSCLMLHAASSHYLSPHCDVIGVSSKPLRLLEHQLPAPLLQRHLAASSVHHQPSALPRTGMTSVLLHLLVRADSSLSLSSYSIVCLLLLAALLYPLYLFLDYTLVQPYTRYRVLASQGIRGPPFIPFVGALPILGWYVFHDKLLDWTTDVVERYGPVSRHERGPITVLQLQDVDYVMAAWKTQARHYRRGSVCFTGPIKDSSPPLILATAVNTDAVTVICSPLCVAPSDVTVLPALDGLCCGGVSQLHRDLYPTVHSW